MDDTIITQLKTWNACETAISWAATQKSPKAAWRNCEHGDWMLWVLGKLSGPPKSESRRKLVLCACTCARLSLKYVPGNEIRPRKAIETVEKWSRGEVGTTLDDVQKAADAAAYAAYATAHAADAAAYAAHAAAAYAADAYAYAYPRTKTLAKCADIVRQYYPLPPDIFAGAGR